MLKGHDFFNDPQFPFAIQRYVIARGEHIPAHAHDFVELAFIESGDAVHEMAGNTYTLAPGDVFVIEQQTEHSYTSTSERETVVYNVLFDAEFLKEELLALQKMPSFVAFFYLTPFLRKSAAFVPYSKLTEEQHVLLLGHLETIRHELQARPEGYQLIVKMRWIECLVLLGRYHQANRNPGAAGLTDRQRIESMLHYIGLHFRQPLSLEQLSRICGMSVSSFTAKFKDVAGASFLDYKQRLQIDYAKRRLSASDDKILEIALESGFNDTSFFNKVFRKHTGMSPRDYRRKTMQPPTAGPQ
ncbi:helix-turn-helix transcriptional regulator [Paenibacillus sp. IB182496]|uniref:Helix-turn-helix transcriptional regulator n=1 Tax=Paenibacillus sabuli TaxID=2772509 RepID=A0A927GQ64_9BACL|nr:AraC family transcriptional regulator [Paenibacillus sabuli]MBD2844199.1 helix-turn-helix transcriptional regulator [Paenibacillus sabuli]